MSTEKDLNKLKATLERKVNILNNVCEVVKAFTDKTDTATLVIYKEECEKAWELFQNAYEPVEDLLTEETEIKTLQSDFTAHHNNILTARINIERFHAHDIVSATLPGNSSFFDENAIKSSFKLPPIRIQLFSGTLEEWPEFKATCDSVLTDNIPEVQRLQYLKDALTGEPRALVRHITPKDGAYEAAWTCLKYRYDNKRSIVNVCLKKLFDLQTIKKEPNTELKNILNTATCTLETLKGYQIDTSSWDSFMVYFLASKLDADNLRHWEESLQGSKAIPALKTFFEFIETRINILNNTISPPQMTNQRFVPTMRSQNRERAQAMLTLNSNFKCFMCGANHVIARCNQLLHAAVRDRIAMVKAKGLCTNCLNRHNECPYGANCRHCDGAHHSMLHENNEPASVHIINTPNENDNGAESEDSVPPEVYEQFFHTRTPSQAILATAIVPISYKGRTLRVRALIDQGSTANLITKRLCQALRLPLTHTYVPLTGPCDVKIGSIKEKTSVTIGSCHDQAFKSNINTYVVKTITGLRPIQLIEPKTWSHLHNLPLADPNFTEFTQIDILLGSITHAEIIQNGLIKGEIGEPIAQRTVLGWIISGAANKVESKQINCNIMLEEASLNTQLQTFWELEEVECQKFRTPDETQATEIFTKSLRRCTDGRLMVDLPFKMDPFDPKCFGESYSVALRRYKAVQHRLAKVPTLQTKYNDCIQEYLTLGHMELATREDVPFVCLPHHPVIKESSSTTKIRPVMDASAKTSNGYSLNDRLYVGPTIQPDLFELLIQWRRFEFAFSGDIEKMYRQVKVNPAHAKFQCILHQLPGETSVKRFKLLTVTFGTASAPYEAIAALDQIGNEIEAINPELAENIQRHFYVDDFLGCEKTLANAKRVRREMTQTLAQYGFNLRKWKASHEEILDDVSIEDREVLLDFESTVKTLGISWQPTTDSFTFNSSKSTIPSKWTKRNVLSEISKLFDPLGWMAPFVVTAKILMQQIWKHETCTDWDSPLPHELLSLWEDIFHQLQNQIPVRIQRWVGLSNHTAQIELHCFADASEKAYCSAIYLRIIENNGRITCNLIAAKTKVAPSKPIITIPRLELCAALLLTKLYKKVATGLDSSHSTVFAWTDSKICLSWLASQPSKWSTFVAHRVSEIQKVIPFQHWAHVPTDQNPADLATRGMSMFDLANSQLWWHGPNHHQHSTAFTLLPDEELPEHRKSVQTFTVTSVENYVLNRFSDYYRLLRFTAIANRWLQRTRNQHNKIVGPISAKEINSAESQWITIVQEDHFPSEKLQLQASRELAPTNVLAQWNPFMDSEGVIRMNGRVHNEDIDEEKTAIILPARSQFVEMLIRDTHMFSALHGGVQLTLRALRQRFLILHGRTTTKSILHKCIICFRFNKSKLKQKMADLPFFRTQRARPFAYVGCDYAGYFDIKTSEVRNAPRMKGYIAVFICLCTKAVHLEMVCSLTTDEFIMALDNFISRRGIPLEFHSDNGTCFTGAAKKLHELHNQWLTQDGKVTKWVTSKRITFKNIPARAAHMGGIWERTVGLIKQHLHRVLKNATLTARHFDHLLKQIEACLNSRPLWTITSESDDAQVLTPSHFFNFEAINTLPRPDLSHIAMNRLNQYQYLQRLLQDFWKLWSKEYLHQLQPRGKWRTSAQNVKVGQAVLISEDNAPPSQWKLGTITAVYPGKDELVRTVDVKTVQLSGHNAADAIVSYTTLKRPIHKLGLLPFIDNFEPSSSLFAPGENVTEP